MRDLKLKWTLWAIRYLLSQGKHHETISSAGQRGGIYDTYWIFLEEWAGGKKRDKKRRESVEPDQEGQEEPVAKGVKRSYNVELIDGQLYRRHRRKSASEKEAKAIKLEYEFLRGKQVYVRHFFKSVEIVSKGAIKPALMRKCWLYWIIYFVDRLQVLVERAKFRSVSDHRKILASVNDLSLRGFTHVWSFTVARDLYGPRYGPDIDSNFDQELKRLSGILETLEDMGALAKENSGFKILPRATALRMEWDREIHRERIQNWNIAFTLLLTAVLAISSGLMAWFQYLRLEQ